MERSSQTYEMRMDGIWVFISLCTHNDMTTPLAPIFNVGMYVQKAALRNLRCSHTLAFCAIVLSKHWVRGGKGVLHRNCCMSDCVNAFCKLFSINSPLEHGHALHCGMNARQICVPIQYNTRSKWMRPFCVFCVHARTCTLLTPRMYNPKEGGSSRNRSRSKSGLIPLIPRILKSIPLQIRTNPTNPTNLDFEKRNIYIISIL